MKVAAELAAGVDDLVRAFLMLEASMTTRGRFESFLIDM
jgi:hypothetical protein